MSRISDILDALVTSLNEGDFSQEFTATRSYTVRIDVTQAGPLQVLVVPRARSSVISTRSAFEEDPAIDIGIIQKLDAIDNAAVDPLLALVEEIGDAVKRLVLGVTPSAAFRKLDNTPVYDQAILKESSVFFAVITVTFHQVV
jgi:hypothetical protein